jgi:hypothetical protein
VASDRLVKFAAGVNAGKSAKHAAIGAGYTPGYADTHAASLLSQARNVGLLMSEDAVRDAAQLVADSLTNPADLTEMLDALKARAKDGDVAALRTWFERMFGGVPQSVRLDQHAETRIVFGYEDEAVVGDD